MDASHTSIHKKEKKSFLYCVPGKYNCNLDLYIQTYRNLIIRANATKNMMESRKVICFKS